MAIDSVIERRSGQEATADVLRGLEYKRLFQVAFTEYTTPHFCFGAHDPDTEIQVPLIGAAHPDNSLAICNNVHPALADGADLVYNVAISYSTIIGEPGDPGENPLAEPAQATWSYRSEDEEYLLSEKIDLSQFGENSQIPPGTIMYPDGRFAVVKSNLKPHDPSVKRRVSTQILLVRFNAREFQPQFLGQYINTVNKREFTILRHLHVPVTFAAATVLLEDVTADLTERAGIRYWAVTLSLAFRPYQFHGQYTALNDQTTMLSISGWDQLRESWGFLEFDTIDVANRIIRQIQVRGPGGALVDPQGPVPLNRFGKYWLVDPEFGRHVSEPFVHRYRPYPRADFSGIGIP